MSAHPATGSPAPGPHWAVWLAALACLAIGLLYPLALVPPHMSLNYTEGWNAFWQARAVAGQAIYTGEASPVTNNYPPLSFYVFGAFGRLVGDQIVGGRILGFATLLACVGMTGVATARLGAGRRWGAAAALAFLLYIACYGWRSLATNQQQWLATIPSLAALLLLLRRDGARPGAGRLVGACALLVLGGLVKHIELAMPLAVTVWLALHDRRGLVVWLAAAAVFVALAVGGLYLSFGPLVFEQVAGHHRTLQARYFLPMLVSLTGLIPGFVMTPLAVRAELRRGADPRVTLVLLFTAFALVLGIVERFGTGVSVNAHFDAAIGLAIVSGVALGRPDVLSPRLRALGALGLFLPALIVTAVNLPGTVAHLRSLPQDEAAWRVAVARVAAAREPVACELPALCYWAGKPLLVDFYNYGQKLRTVGDPIGLKERLARREYGLIVVVRGDSYRSGDPRLPPDYNRLIDAGYRPVLALPEHVFLLERRPAAQGL